jgi:hypothetical protein
MQNKARLVTALLRRSDRTFSPTKLGTWSRERHQAMQFFDTPEGEQENNTFEVIRTAARRTASAAVKLL